ncbi:hypothetical protein AWY79_03235 [Pseudodesulfovibrio indicus]|uniref:Uncharacterized protein n=1 Tax=Pseudodesulfovibrio indicus TaxID=1716143 RepID=A0ABN4LUF4_9BACT|nr:hypothetical protein AWY79_03235 [Pseudodesulfovibrio indicus]
MMIETRSPISSKARSGTTAPCQDMYRVWTRRWTMPTRPAAMRIQDSLRPVSGIRKSARTAAASCKAMEAMMIRSMRTPAVAVQPLGLHPTPELIDCANRSSGMPPSLRRPGGKGEEGDLLEKVPLFPFPPWTPQSPSPLQNFVCRFARLEG